MIFLSITVTNSQLNPTITVYSVLLQHRLLEDRQLLGPIGPASATVDRDGCRIWVWEVQFSPPWKVITLFSSQYRFSHIQPQQFHHFFRHSPVFHKTCAKTILCLNKVTKTNPSAPGSANDWMPVLNSCCPLTVKEYLIWNKHKRTVIDEISIRRTRNKIIGSVKSADPRVRKVLYKQRWGFSTAKIRYFSHLMQHQSLKRLYCKRTTRFLTSCCISHLLSVRSILRYCIAIARCDYFIGRHALFWCERYGWRLSEFCSGLVEWSNITVLWTDLVCSYRSLKGKLQSNCLKLLLLRMNFFNEFFR
jgi:hypothetical protein